MAEAALLEPTDISVDYEHLVTRLVQLMRTSDDPLTLEDLAEMAGLSPFHFARIFRAVAGVPPVEFQTALRFERAKTLLLTSPASVTEICYEVGYGSLGTFSRRFKQMVGVTPATFRELPHSIAGMTLDDAVTRRTVPDTGSIATVEGTVVAPGLSSRVYIGLFADRIPVNRPVVGQLLPEPGPFCLPNVPVGRYSLMAAAFPIDVDPISHLIPSAGIHVGGGGAVEVCAGNERVHRTVMMRPVSQIDVPVLTALPALLL